MTLTSCMRKFHTTEKLDDDVYCSTCEIHKPHLKTLTTFRLPPILVIQLKRFKKMGANWLKQKTTVEFPFTNLDMKPHLYMNGEFLNRY